MIAGLLRSLERGDWVIRIAVTGRVVCRISADCPGAEDFAELFVQASKVAEDATRYRFMREVAELSVSGLYLLAIDPTPDGKFDTAVDAAMAEVEDAA